MEKCQTITVLIPTIDPDIFIGRFFTYPKMTRGLVILLLVWVKAKNIYHANYNNDYNIPTNYDKIKCPNTTVFVDIGLFFIALVNLGENFHPI